MATFRRSFLKGYIMNPKCHLCGEEITETIVKVYEQNSEYTEPKYYHEKCFYREYEVLSMVEESIN